MSAHKETTIIALHRLCETVQAVLEFESTNNNNTINVTLPNCTSTIFTLIKIAKLDHFKFIVRHYARRSTRTVKVFPIQKIPQNLIERNLLLTDWQILHS